MAKTAEELREIIAKEIDDKRFLVKVQQKEVSRNEYLETICKRCEEERLEEDATKEIVFFVDKTLWGFGLLDGLINTDDTVSDIRLMGANNVRLKRLGKREKANIQFKSDEEFSRYIEFITNRNQTTISVNNAAQVFTDKESSPTNILRFTLASDLINSSGKPSLLIRKIPKKKKTLDSLISEGFISRAQAEYLKRRWKEGHGILISGPNGSGKTTLINALLEETPHEKSAVIIQESEELFCNTHPEMVFRKVVPKRGGVGVSYDLRDLTRLSLMESFDALVIGEIKGGEAAYLAYATYTGSPAMTSVHSISAKDGYEKMIDYALEEHPERNRAHFAKQLQTLDTSVYVEDYQVKEIVELVGYNAETEQYNFKNVSFDGGI